MAQLAAAPLFGSGGNYESLADVHNELEASLAMDDKDFDDERRVYRTNMSAMEAEIRRLTAEVRTLRESQIDAEVTQLALENGFLSPFGAARRPRRNLFSSTPQSTTKGSRFGEMYAHSPQATLNASTILDDEEAFSLDAWPASPIAPTAPSLPSSLSSSKVDASPTSKLLARGHFQAQGLAQSLRPKPLFVTGSSNQPAANAITRSPAKLETTETPNKSEKRNTENGLLPLAPHPIAIDSPSNSGKHSLSSTVNSRSPIILSRLSPLQEEDDYTPPTSPTEFPTTSPSPKRSNHAAHHMISSTPLQRKGELAATPTHMSSTPQRLRESEDYLQHSFQITPKNGPFDSMAEEATPRVLTRIVYVTRSSHWCEQLLQIVFFLLLVLISFSFGIVFGAAGPPEWLYGPPRTFLS